MNPKSNNITWFSGHTTTILRYHVIVGNTREKKLTSYKFNKLFYKCDILSSKHKKVNIILKQRTNRSFHIRKYVNKIKFICAWQDLYIRIDDPIQCNVVHSQ